MTCQTLSLALGLLELFGVSLSKTRTQHNQAQEGYSCCCSSIACASINNRTTYPPRMFLTGKAC